MANVSQVKAVLDRLKIETPSWAYGNSGTRFKVFAQPGVPRDPFEKIADAAQVNKYTGAAPSVALHIPWDKVADYAKLAAHAKELGVVLGTINSNTFQDDEYKLGSVCNPDPKIREAGARVKFIQDGDVAAAIEAARPSTSVDLLMGIGGTPEGVITAAAMICLGGVIQGLLRPKDDAEKESAIAAGYKLDQVYTTRDLVNSDDVFMAATGITDGELLKGVKYSEYGAVSQSLVMRGKSRTVRFVETEHHLK